MNCLKLYSTPQKTTMAAAVGDSPVVILRQHSGSGAAMCTPHAVRRGGRLQLLPVINRTPVSKLTAATAKVIVNPFEAALTERLHLPFIGSPSLFQRPSTPQLLSSTQFEWTIDEVASLGPAHVEAHETQFTLQTDPEMEARAQEAITTYFRDRHVLPSPINCPLRETKIVFDDTTINTPTPAAAAAGAATEAQPPLNRAKTRNSACQTVLSFPATLPAEMEAMLAPFCTFHEDQQGENLEEEEEEEETNNNKNHHDDPLNASLRRRLFEASMTSEDLDAMMAEQRELAEEERDDEEAAEENKRHSICEPFDRVAPISTPELNLTVNMRSRNFGSPDEDRERESFGSLSPIMSVSSTPKLNFSSRNQSSTSSLYRSTPDRLRSTSENSVEMMSVQGESSPMRPTRTTGWEDSAKRKNTSLPDRLLLVTDESSDDLMQVSRWSETTEEHMTTPVRRHTHKAATMRKNLSHSFSQMINDEDGDDDDNDNDKKEECDLDVTAKVALLDGVNSSGSGSSNNSSSSRAGKDMGNDVERMRTNKRETRVFPGTKDATYRTDSGFSDEDLSQQCAGVHMMSCLPLARRQPAMGNVIFEEDVSMHSWIL